MACWIILDRVSANGSLIACVWRFIRKRPDFNLQQHIMSVESQQTRVGTGVEGLDYILGGGLPLDRVYVVQGNPGSGKTTLAIQFLRQGVQLGESVLLVALAETAEELREVASSHGWS